MKFSCDQIFIHVILGIVQHILISSGCLFKITDRSTNQARSIAWDTNTYKRIPYNRKDGSSCNCGVYDPKSPQFYELFIYADTGPASFWTKCVGVPVASNLVLASHRCFLKYGEKLYPYQLWENADGPRNSTAPIDTMVIRKNDFSRPFRVKTLIFNPIYVITARYNEVLPEEDVVIVVSETNLFDKGFNSLCLPTYNDDKPLDVFYQEGHYIGIGGILKIEDPTMETRYLTAVTLRGVDCDKELPFGFRSRNSTICLRFRLPGPTLEGGSLTVTGRDDDKEFIVGIASKVNLNKKGTGFNYAYFTNLIPYVKFIERQALLHNSTWCEPLNPQFMAPPKNKSNIKAEPFPWESPNKLKERKHTLDCVCGIKNTGKLRISGGNDSGAYEYPWQIKLFINFPLLAGGEGISICGGTLINDMMILTAAHCVISLESTEEQIEPIEIFALVRSHLTVGDPNNVQLSIKKTIVHPDYWPTKQTGITESDLALLVLSEPFPYSPGTDIVDFKLRPVCLPEVGKTIQLQGRQALTLGWGLTDLDNRTNPTVLQKLELPILELGNCSILTESPITDKVICAGFLNKTKSSLQGDSGGPLMIQNEEDLFVQVGAVSYGARDTLDGPWVTLYVDLQYYMPFIEYHAQQEGAKWCQPAKKGY